LIFGLGLGAGYWMRNVEALKRAFEIVARNMYMKEDERDPVACALYYLALNKKNVCLFEFFNKEKGKTRPNQKK